jgi:hypothetical protein
LSKTVSLFVAHLSVCISIRIGFKENVSCKEKKILGSLVLDPLPSATLQALQLLSHHAGNTPSRLAIIDATGSLLHLWYKVAIGSVQ